MMTEQNGPFGRILGDTRKSQVIGYHNVPNVRTLEFIVQPSELHNTFRDVLPLIKLGVAQLERVGESDPKDDELHVCRSHALEVSQMDAYDVY